MTEDETLERYSWPGHDRDCLRAMRSQVRHGNPLDLTQVDHLLRIAWTAGATTEHELLYEDVTDDCRPVFDYAKAVAQTGRSGSWLVYAIVRVYGPTLPWRRRLRLAAYLAFRKGYSA